MRWLVLLILAGCSPSQTRPDPVAPVVGAPLSPSGTNAWNTRNFSQRHSMMTFTMLPVMARAFQSHDETVSAELSCIACHGRDAEEVRYQMPGSLPALDPEHLPQTDRARWMAEFVTPTADRLMRAGGTTTCFTCHPSAETE